MPTTFSMSEAAVERSTAVLLCSFTDESKNAVVPTSITWTLTNKSGGIVNSRDAVAITPDSTVAIVLHGDDLALPAGVSDTVTVTVEAKYNSTYGLGLPLNDACTLHIEALSAVD